MEGWVARWYARTRQNDLAQFRQDAKAVAERLPSGSNVLEVAPGPGFFAVELAKMGDFKITGLDVSRTMVGIANENARKAGVKIDFRLGNASAMPFPDGSFDLVYCSAAFKNFSEPVKALDEMHRVLRRGCEAVIVDLSKEASLAEINTYAKHSGRSSIDAWITTQAFRHLLLKRAYTRDQFTGMAKHSRFGSCKITGSTIAFEIRLKKQAA
jgi:ubiquinone/menaquinone biosynthesis C-methylase UbiE